VQRVLLLGAGKIGALISGLLAESGGYEVQLADLDEGAAADVARAHALPSVEPLQLDARDAGALQARLRDHPVHALVSSLPYYCNPLVANEARAAGVHYFDLTEDVSVTRRVSALAEGAHSAFVPQCGLAPGFISIAGGELIRHFDQLRSVRLRVGALPQHPHNVLKYSLTWSTEGLINEYGNPCEAVVDSRLLEVRPLEGLEEIEIDGTLYEAFNTSGGLGTLAQSAGERCEFMDYKTIRYPGHCAQMRLLMNDLKLNADRDTLKRILENAVPQTLQDVVIVYAAVTGLQGGELREENYVSKIYPQLIAGRLWSAIQVSTAAGLCAVLDLVLATPERYHGMVTQESFRLPAILANRFGKHLAAGSSKDLSADIVLSGMGGRQRSTALASVAVWPRLP
jgi:saccharopine dehydrogenase-like NADP-dependent oxidoreductase